MDLSIFGNDALTSIDGFDALRSTGRSLSIATNVALTDINGFQSLTSVGGYLSIPYNFELTRLSAFSALTSIGDFLSIYLNYSLTDLDGFGALTFIGSHLQIVGNNGLTNLDNFSSLTTVGSDFYVIGNDVLARCALGLGPIILADQSAPSTIQGSVSIRDNAPGGDCNSVESILDAYIELPAEGAQTLTAKALAVYPNPAAARATFTFALEGAAEATLVVYDALGREVARLIDGAVQGREQLVFDAGALPAGLYVARLVAGERVETVRLSVVR